MQRGIVQAALERHPLVEEFYDAPESHLGATVAGLTRTGSRTAIGSELKHAAIREHVRQPGLQNPTPGTTRHRTRPAVGPIRVVQRQRLLFADGAQHQRHVGGDQHDQVPAAGFAATKPTCVIR